jgi:hypothetical protein
VTCRRSCGPVQTHPRPKLLFSVRPTTPPATGSAPKTSSGCSTYFRAGGGGRSLH